MSALVQKWIPAIIVAAGLAGAGWFVGQGVEGFRKADRYITIKGLAEKDARSDYAIWVISFRRASQTYQELQQVLMKDREEVVSFLKNQGFSEQDIEARSLQMTDLMAREYGQQDGFTFRYTGQGSVVVRTSQVEEVSRISNQLDPLIQAGVQISSDGPNGGAPRYLLRGFNDIKPLLLEQAVKNAAEQAEKFAADAGAKLGKIKQANQGSIQILDDDGTDEYSSGMTIGKRLRVVSTFVYSLE
ncbi:SIMPL domain-containing protein [Orrella marina]|uniref:SIMPL domain-containing protein n=1 Tax=Orrella marina TaxID=2163011 RepID=A0A2R4XID4_9BURK|nr:SIMPL domain-containing protein [Orrella marina]AWB33489.1 SIMPL domain-containing protein [Orrella marina]